ncbi:MAG: FAD-binding domain-containing protein, partial [Deltaproteobacteria bacterium]|nr:FAD-binding domain-containing protein [Deltaproteobacteria bacterium]
LYRTFNPFLQAARFDPDAVYIKKYVPELRELEPSQINSYHFIYTTKLRNYPSPVTDVKESARQFRMLIVKER